MVVKTMMNVKLIVWEGGVTNVKDCSGHDPGVGRGSGIRTGVRFRFRFGSRDVSVGETGSLTDVGDQVDELAEREVQGGSKPKLAEDDVILNWMRGSDHGA